MRTNSSLTFSALGLCLALGSPAFADSACYVARDADGLFDPARIAPLITSGEAQDLTPAGATLSEKNRGAIQRCYNKALARNPLLAGGLELGVKVGPGGAVERVSVLRTGHTDAMLNSCLGQQVCGWQFAAPGKPAYLALPFDHQQTDATMERPDFLDPKRVK